MENKIKSTNIKFDEFNKLMDDITFIYEKFKSISIRDDFATDDDVFKGIKICLNPNFWLHSFNFKNLDKFKKVNKLSVIDWIKNEINH